MYFEEDYIKKQRKKIISYHHFCSAGIFECRYRLVFIPSKMFRDSFFIFALLLVSGKANTDSPITKMIRLAIGVSKSAYLPLEGSRYIQDGRIFGIKEPSSSDGSEEGIVCNVGGWVGKSYKNKETELILFTHIKQKLAVFGFRGTESTNLKDWQKNFQLKLVDSSVGSTVFKLHQGFRDRYLSIASWFEAKYKAIPADYTIMMTGHSLGGALATIAPVYASGKLNRRPDAVITFASPKVGDQDFHDYYAKVVGCGRTLRIATKDDVITKVPFGGRYTHVCNALEVNGHVGFLSNLNVVRTHSLLGGYKTGLERKFPNVEEINFGCDKQIRQ